MSLPPNCTPYRSASHVGARIDGVIQKLGKDPEHYAILLPSCSQGSELWGETAFCRICDTGFTITENPYIEGPQTVEFHLDCHLKSFKHRKHLAKQLNVHECILSEAVQCTSCFGWFTDGALAMHLISPEMCQPGSQRADYCTTLQPHGLDPSFNTGSSVAFASLHQAARENYLRGFKGGPEVFRYYSVSPSAFCPDASTDPFAVADFNAHWSPAPTEKAGPSFSIFRVIHAITLRKKARRDHAVKRRWPLRKSKKLAREPSFPGATTIRLV